jgi:hypothetical protein
VTVVNSNGAASPLRVQLDDILTDPGSIGIEIGSTGLRQFGGFIQEEFLQQLSWPLAGRVFREMGDNDATTSAMLLAIELLERQVSWRTTPADDSRLAAEIADHCDSCRGDMLDTWPDTQSSIGTTRQFGFGLFEKVYKRRLGPKGGPPTDAQPFGQPKSKYDDGKIGWENLPIRAQDTIWRWDYQRTASNERLVGANQRTLTHAAVSIPMAKLLHFRTSALKDNPLGRSMLRGAWRPWLQKRRIEDIEAVGIERDLVGLPVMWLPPEYLAPDAAESYKALANTLREAVKNVRRNEADGMMLPYDENEKGNNRFKFELLTTGGQRQFDTTKVIERLDHRILLNGLADFLLLGAQGVGSLGFSMGTTRVELFSASLDANLTMVGTEVTDNGYRELVELNGWPVELTPTLEHDTVQEVDITKLFDAIVKLSQAGVDVFPDPQLSDWLLDQLDAPHMSAEEKGAQDLLVETEVTNRVNAQLAELGKMNQGGQDPNAPDDANAQNVTTGGAP